MSGRRARIAAEAVVVGFALPFALFAWIATPEWLELHGTAYRCIRDVHELSMGSFLRWCSGATALLAMTVIRPLVGKRFERTGLSLRGVVANLVAVLLALVVCEIVLRKPWQAPPPPFVCPMCADAVPDARLGWKLAPSQDHIWQAPDGPIEYVTDEAGRRMRKGAPPIDPSKPTIVIGGESIAMGSAVAYEDSFAGLLEQRLGVQIYDAAVFGYTMDQAYLTEVDVVARLEHVDAIVTTFVPEQVERPERDALRRLHADADGRLVPADPVAPWIRDLALFRLFRSFDHGNTELDDMRAVARATLELGRRRGARVLFVTTNFADPCLPVRGKPPALFALVFDSQGVPRVHVDLAATDRQHGDPHPGPASHRRLADAIENALADPPAR